LPDLNFISLFSKEGFHCKEELSFVARSVICKMDIPVRDTFSWRTCLKRTKVIWEHVLHFQKYIFSAVKSVAASAIPELISN